MKTTLIQVEVLRVVREQKGKATVQKIMDALGIERRSCENALYRLKAAKKIVCVRTGVYKATTV